MRGFDVKRTRHQIRTHNSRVREVPHLLVSFLLVRGRSSGVVVKPVLAFLLRQAHVRELVVLDLD